MVDLIEFLTVKNSLRMVLLVVLFGYTVGSLFLMLRIRILAETLKTDKVGFVSFLAKLHFFMVLIGSIIVSILILL